MPVSALPSRTGVGELGASAFQWIDILKDSGVTIWQLLPLNPVGFGNSPYQPYSSYAGDELYISLELLEKEGLLDSPAPAFRENEKRVDYDEVRAFKEPYLRKAFEAFTKGNGQQKEDYQTFTSQKWVRGYGVFRALGASYGGAVWNEWKPEDKEWIITGGSLSEETEREAAYQTFLQYEFYTQWMNVKKKANEAGIQVMGDVPFYVGLNSADVWGSRENFLLDKDGRPTYIAGVPPDYFSPTGQRWGNPIYNWDHMKENNYQFWVDRIGYSSRMFDIVRIDHFRAFDTYWKIPASCPTAVEGEWIEAPGYEVLDTLKEKIPGVNLVAEDLGELRPEVHTLKNHYHLKGMKILVFSFETKGKYAFDSAEDSENMILYTGTHDNDTLLEWYGNLTKAEKRKIRRFLKKKGYSQGSVKDRLLAYALRSRAEFVIFPAQDIMGLGKEGHMNTPGTVGSPNWEWRMPEFSRFESELKRYKKMAARTF